MSKVKFSSKQQEILRNNKYTVRVTANILSLSKEFKEIFYKEYLSGEIPSIVLHKPKFPGVICNYINRYASSSDKVFGNEL